jgi:phage baseplate assembly protein W
MSVDIPHFAFPFQRNATGTKVNVVEQDMLEHVDACCQTIIRCPTGWRVDRPEFGWKAPEFQTMPVDTTALLSALRRHEPRARPSADQYVVPAEAAAAGLSITEEVAQ